jgi:hypothetical protein
VRYGDETGDKTYIIQTAGDLEESWTEMMMDSHHTIKKSI